jgi:hypothetical protein
MEKGGGGGAQGNDIKTGWACRFVQYIPCTGNTPYINSMLLRNVNKPVCAWVIQYYCHYTVYLYVQCKQFSIYGYIPKRDLAKIQLLKATKYFQNKVIMF